MQRILDLGCGTAKVDGAIGVDIVPLHNVDVIANLAAPPYPFASNLFDTIYLNDVIEHLPDTIGTMEELYRLARQDARIFIRVINWNSHYTAMDPTHVKSFTENTFDFFGKRVGRSYYSRARFDVVRVVYGYNSIARKFFPSERLMYFLSRFLNNVLEDLNFELRTVKDEASLEDPARPEPTDLLDLLRCPHCVTRKVLNCGKLILVKNVWLVCQDCGRKYPVINGSPIMLLREGDKWLSTPAETLPDVSDEYKPTEVEATSIGSIEAPDANPAPILSPGEFLHEVGHVYAAALIQVMAKRWKRYLTPRRLAAAGLLVVFSFRLGLLTGQRRNRRQDEGNSG